jgi:tetratricopeptide (TPR) repeat protein
MFLLLIAPTSSFIPIHDVLAEHRMYLPFLGLVLICCEALRRLKFAQMIGIGATALIICSMLTYQRNQVWSSPLALWQDSVNKSPNKYRPRFQLARQLYDENRCLDAVQSYDKASRLGPLEDQLLIDWALALDCARRPVDEVVDKFRQAAAIYDTAHVHTQIAAEYARHKRYQEALEELDQAEKIDPNYDVTFFYRGGVAEALGNRAEAQRFYRRALELNPQDRPARDALARVSQ